MRPDSIGFGGVFPYMGLAIPRMRLKHRRVPPCQTNVASSFDDQRERTAIRKDPPRREFSGRVVDHSSASSGADPELLQFRQDRRRHRRSRDARRRRKASASRPARSGIARQGRHPEGGGQSAPRARRARDAAAPRARCADRVPDGRHQASLRELGRGDPLLPLFGDAGRPLHARRPRREHLDLGRFRCAVRRPADQQSSAGLRQGLPRSQPRLPAARRAGGSRRHRRDARRGEVAAGSCCSACRRSRCGPKPCSTKANRSAPK